MHTHTHTIHVIIIKLIKLKTFTKSILYIGYFNSTYLKIFVSKTNKPKAPHYSMVDVTKMTSCRTS